MSVKKIERLRGNVVGIFANGRSLVERKRRLKHHYVVYVNGVFHSRMMFEEGANKVANDLERKGYSNITIVRVGRSEPNP